MGPNGAQDITPLSDDEQERDGESLTRRKYFCMRLVSEYLCLVETGAKMLATGGLQLSSVTNAAEEPQNWAWPGGMVPRLTRLCCLWQRNDPQSHLLRANRSRQHFLQHSDFPVTRI